MRKKITEHVSLSLSELRCSQRLLAVAHFLGILRRRVLSKGIGIVATTSQALLKKPEALSVGRIIICAVTVQSLFVAALCLDGAER